MAENWKVIPGFDPAYEVSDRGRVRTWKVRGRGKNLSDKPKIMSPAQRKSGYLCVCLRHEGRSRTCDVHVLVLLAFYGPKPKGKESCHKNGLSLDNRASNLYWGTHVENCFDRICHGNAPRGEKHGRARLSDDDVRNIRRRFMSGENPKVIASSFGISYAHALDVAKGRKWRHVT